MAVGRISGAGLVWYPDTAFGNRDQEPVLYYTVAKWREILKLTRVYDTIMDQSRFAYLLQPIRDLTKNWDIDVASQLEEYISEVGA